MGSVCWRNWRTSAWEVTLRVDRRGDDRGEVRRGVVDADVEQEAAA